MKKNFVVLLSGSGFLDGSEIYETVLTLFILDKLGIGYMCTAPNGQTAVVNHISRVENGESRSLFAEAARLARGDIKPIHHIDADYYDGLIIPGGYGVAKHLCNYAVAGPDMIVDPLVSGLASSFFSRGKPIGLMCIAATLAPLIGGAGTLCTVGNDPETIRHLIAMGARHQSATASECVIDWNKKIVSTPAYMVAERISDMEAGILAMVEALISLSSQ